MPIRRNPGVEILMHFRWHVAAGELTPAAIGKIGPYVMRYAETLNIRVHAVGGMADHLHLLADIPPDMPADRFSRELLAPTARYLRDVQAARDFLWDSDVVAITSISPTECATVVAYIMDQETRHESGALDSLLEESEEAPRQEPTATDEDLPGWLTNALQ